MPGMKRAVKDSVFTLMFREPQYALQLYQALHPEDTDVTEDDCEIVTLENVLTIGEYNDFGLRVRNRLLLLVEAQSTFSRNVALRILLYLAATYKRHVEEHKLDLYGVRAVRIPRPELYVVYTGPRQDIPDTLHLSDLYEGEGVVKLELEVKVCRSSGTQNILEQYVRFCKIADENRKEYGATPKTIEETLRQCRKEGILVPFLASREKEVQDIMVTLFDQEKLWEIHDYNVAKDARQAGLTEGMEKGIEKGIEKGMEKGREEGAEMTLLTNLRALMKKLNFTAEEAMDTLGVPAETRDRLAAQL